jgi:phosphate:Na+ symporter
LAIKEIFIVICSIVLFLVGVINLSNAVRKLIDVRIKEYIKYAVGRPFFGLLTGIFSTIIFQSSGTSTALTISLVSAGLIGFSNSLAIILGADIGTTLTVQFVVWRFTKISPLIISIGGLLWLAGKENWKTIGEMIFYFGLMFFGLDLISNAVEPLKNSPLLIDMFTKTQNPWIGLGAGIVVTGIVHASAIPISITVLLAQQDLISLENAVAIVMGANIGTTFTALLAGTVATKSGLRTAFSHLIFKCVGVGLCFIFMPFFIDILNNISMSTAQQIAFAHFLINLVIVTVFIFLLTPFAFIMQTLVPGDDEVLPIWPEFLDSKDITTPQKALDNVHREIQRQANLAQQIYIKSIKMITNYKEEEGKSLFYIEMVVKSVRKQTIKYLRKISAQSLSEQFSKKIFAYTAMTNDIERIGSHALCINTLAFHKADRRIIFSFPAEQDLNEIIGLVTHNFEDAASMIEKPDIHKNREVAEREELIDIKVKESRDKHLERFHKRLCDPAAGPVFVEILLHLERISDLCNNLSEYMCDIQESPSS